MIGKIFTNEPVPVNGEVTLTDKPGFGAEFNNEVELEDASEFEKKGTATITDADGSEIITWKSKKGNQLVGIGGLTRAFVAASIVVAKDDLQIIKGIGPFIEEKLNALGIYMFVQIARMTSELEEEVNVAIEFFPVELNVTNGLNRPRN